MRFMRWGLYVELCEAIYLSDWFSLGFWRVLGLRAPGRVQARGPVQVHPAEVRKAAAVR